MSYQDEAMRTAAHDHEAIYVRLSRREVLHALYRVHQDFAELGDRADALKKYIYYGQGQPPQSEEMLQPPLTDHLRGALANTTHIELIHGLLGLLTETRELWDDDEYRAMMIWRDPVQELDNTDDCSALENQTCDLNPELLNCSSPSRNESKPI